MLQRKGGSIKEERIINSWVLKNLIYCEDTESFVHRLYYKWGANFPTNKGDAQNDVWEVIKEMNLDEQSRMCECGHQLVVHVAYLDKNECSYFQCSCEYYKEGTK